jgi:hypothetical protein
VAVTFKEYVLGGSVLDKKIKRVKFNKEIIVTSEFWWCGVDVGVFIYITAQLETPREGYDEHSNKSSLSCETKVYRTSRRKNQTSEG